MSRITKVEEIRRANDDANSAKERLMEIEARLWEAGAVRKAKSLGTIIAKLEEWQHK